MQVYIENAPALDGVVCKHYVAYLCGRTTTGKITSIRDISKYGGRGVLSRNY
jgi:hypothetical protein